MKNTTAMADYELRHIEALRKDLAGCTVLLKKDGSFPLEKPCTLAAYGSGVRRTIRGGTGSTLRAMQQFTLFPAFPVRATTARRSRAISA